MPHILLIEDYRDTRECAELILRDAGYTVTSASDGIEGLQMAVQCQPDLILMDLSLPHLNGWDAARRLKATSITHHIPIAAFTAHLQPEQLAQARAAGCSTIITKPFDIDDLLSDIAAILAQQPTCGCRHRIDRTCDN
jgi:two-component system, cell cycle response regulator DivK